MATERKKLQVTAPYEEYEKVRQEFGWRAKEGYEHAITYDVFNKAWAAALKWQEKQYEIELDDIVKDIKYTTEQIENGRN